MSDKGPTITVTRGKKKASKSPSASAEERSRSSSGGLGLPGPRALVSGLARGMRTAWWTGLGILAVAQDAGSKVFDMLVEEGKSWEQARRDQAEARVRQMRTLVEQGEGVEAVEERVHEEVDTVLRRIGVPRRDDLDELREQVDALSEKIEHLSQSVEETGTDET